jgi:hypothetical protein
MESATYTKLLLVRYGEGDPHRQSSGQTKNPDPAKAEPGFLDLLSF